MKKILSALLFSCFLLMACTAINGGGVITAGDVLNADKEADILKYDGRIYSNTTDLEWFEKEKSKFKKGEKLGEIRKVQASPLFFGNFSATKLSEGTVLYNSDDVKEGVRPGIILAEKENGEILYYLEQLRE